MPASTAPVKHASMRASNLGLVLRAVADGGDAVTRAQVATTTRLTKSSVASLTGDLIAARLVVEAAAAPRNEPGRPGSTIALAADGAAGLGLEVNVDYLAAILTDLRGTPRYRHVLDRDNVGRPVDDVLADLRTLAVEAVAAAGEQGLDVAGACVAVPATVHGTTVVSAPNLEWSDLDLDLPTIGHLGTRLENEANLAALGELWSGGVPRDFIHVSGEIGIGGGIVVDGSLFRGVHRAAGELGHVVVAADGPPCTCGGRGCLERMAGLSAILVASGAPDRATLERRCADGDPAALSAVADAGRWLGVGLASAANLLDPAAVILGGAFAGLAPWLAPAVDVELARRIPRTGRPRVLTGRLGTDAAVRGAAGSVVRRVVEDPATYLSLRGTAWA